MGQFISSSERSRGPQSTCVKSNEPLPYSDGLPKHIPAKSQGHSWQNTNVHRGGGHISAPSQGWYARRSGRLTTHLYCCINLGLPATLDATTRHQTRGAISLQRSRVDRTCFSFWLSLRETDISRISFTPRRGCILLRTLRNGHIIPTLFLLILSAH